jgi:hypothetical protein
MVVREFLDEWHERKEERLAKMNPQRLAGEQINMGKIVEVVERFNAELESKFERYQSYIEELIREYL